MSEPNSSPPPAIPLYAVTLDAAGKELVVKRRPGRPRKVMPAPSAIETDYISEVNEAREHHISSDAIVDAIDEREGADQVLLRIIEALATETASLAFEIRQGRKAGKDTSQLSSRRIDGLSKIALIELGRKKLCMGDELARSDNRMSIIINFFLATVTGVLVETLPVPLGARVRILIETRIREWQAEERGPAQFGST
jgi:hypothetical protein